MWLIYLLIVFPCYALETYICHGVGSSYSCTRHSRPEPEYLEDVIHVYESEGFSESYPREEESPPEPYDTSWLDKYLLRN